MKPHGAIRLQVDMVPLLTLVGSGLAFGAFVGFHNLRRNPDVV